ncbi:MAG: hypothetical protein AB7O65_04325 [Candidatus Korobacteraceae bacterium]
MIAKTFAVVAVMTIHVASHAPPSDFILAVAGKADRTFAMADFRALPHREVVATDMDGKPTHYGGDLLVAGGAPRDAELRGNNMALFVVVEARDGYKAVFSLTELSPSFGGETVLIADR